MASLSRWKGTHSFWPSPSYVQVPPHQQPSTPHAAGMFPDTPSHAALEHGHIKERQPRPNRSTQLPDGFLLGNPPRLLPESLLSRNPVPFRGRMYVPDSLPASPLPTVTDQCSCPGPLLRTSRPTKQYQLLPTMSGKRLDVRRWYETQTRRAARRTRLPWTGFEQRTQIANWVNVGALLLTIFLLLSFSILPVKWTHRHYLSICLTISVGLIEVSWPFLWLGYEC